MAAVFCLVVPPGFQDGAGIARRLADSMRFFPWQTSHWEEAIEGRVYLGVVAVENPQQRLPAVFAESGDVVCAMEGRVIRSLEAGVDLLHEGVPAHAHAAIEAYRRFGSGFASRLEGQFTAILVDRAARKLVVATARHENGPLYSYCGNGFRLFASRLGPMAACGVFKPQLDPVSVSTFLTYSQLLERQSLISGVSVVDGATTLEIDLESGRESSERYWEYGDAGPHNALPFAVQVDRACELMNAAADRMVAQPGRYVTGLSGGNDSRLVVGMAARRRRDLRAWTFGTRDAADMRIAGRICRVLDIGHLTYPVRPQDTPLYAETYATLVDGCVTLRFAHQIGRAYALRDEADIVLNGYGGNYLIQGDLLDLRPISALRATADRLRGRDAAFPQIEQNVTNRHLGLYLSKKYGHPTGLARLAAPVAPPYAKIAEQLLDALGDRVPAIYQAERWGFEQRGRRWTIMGIVRDRNFYSDGSLFYDYDFFDYCLTVPYAQRRGNRLFIEVLRRTMPELSRIASGNTGLPPTATPNQILAMKVARRLKIVPPRLRGGASMGGDFDRWLRTVLRGYYTDLISDSRTLGRPVWDGVALRQHLDAHMRGDIDFGHELSLVACVELFARQWVDGRG